MKKHYERRHTDQVFEKDYPNVQAVKQLQDNTQKEMEAKQRKETQKLVDNMKIELKSSLKGSLDNLEKEIKAIRGE